jgi:hypothetical protein
MNKQPAHDFTLSLGGNTVRLRPSLRAVSTLERHLDGFINLFRNVEQFHVGTITKIITACATSDDHATAFLRAASNSSLKEFREAAYQPITELCLAFIPVSDGKQPTQGKPIAWSDHYAELYRMATGWLGWSPDTAWNATPTEITEAYAGRIAMLQAIHGTSDDQPKEVDPHQVESNLADGLDPDFDREGLRALKAKIAGAS